MLMVMNHYDSDTNYNVWFFSHTTKKFLDTSQVSSSSTIYLE